MEPTSEHSETGEKKEKLENTFAPENMADEKYTPFWEPQRGEDSTTSRKFVEIGGDTLKKLSEDRGFEISEEQAKEGIILIGKVPESRDFHSYLVEDAFNFEFDYSENKPTDFPLENAGIFYVNMDDKDNVMVLGNTGSMRVTNRDRLTNHWQLSDAEVKVRHENTSRRLNKIYKNTSARFKAL